MGVDGCGFQRVCVCDGGVGFNFEFDAHNVFGYLHK